MKIFLNLLLIAIIVLVLIILTQNADQVVDVEVLTYSQTGINLVFVMIISFTVGAMFGAAFMAFSAIQAKAKVREIQRQNRSLTSELDKLRNISIDEIPDQDEMK